MGQAESLVILWLAKHFLWPYGLVPTGDDVVQKVMASRDAWKMAHLRKKPYLQILRSLSVTYLGGMGTKKASLSQFGTNSVDNGSA